VTNNVTGRVIQVFAVVVDTLHVGIEDLSVDTGLAVGWLVYTGITVGRARKTFLQL